MIFPPVTALSWTSSTVENWVSSRLCGRVSSLLVVWLMSSLLASGLRCRDDSNLSNRGATVDQARRVSAVSIWSETRPGRILRFHTHRVSRSRVVQTAVIALHECHVHLLGDNRASSEMRRARAARDGALES